MTTAEKPDGLQIDTAKEVVSRPAIGHRHRSSLSPSVSMAALPTVINPEPAYIAPAAAANIVTSEVVTQFNLPMYDDDEATVAPGALFLINSFLDRLLFNFLSCSHSTSLASLRPAVTEVLKPKLAKEAIQSADEELQEYIGGDEDELDAFHNGKDQPHQWDLDLIWKRTRLRCMVYTRLGDMEEDDEEMYIEQEDLEDDESQRVSRDIGIVSPAVAIFLTSILEFVGEHALMIAAHAAYRRFELKARTEGRSAETVHEISVEEIDMEKVAFNPIMGRLWRTWRKFVRSPRDSRVVRGFSPVSDSRRGSFATNEPQEEDAIPTVEEVLQQQDPATIPLPISEYDVDEIEVPGFHRGRTASRSGIPRPFSTFIPGDWMDHADEEPSLDLEPDERPRPHSMILEPSGDMFSEDEESIGDADDDYKTPQENPEKKLDQFAQRPEGTELPTTSQSVPPSPRDTTRFSKIDTRSNPTLMPEEDDPLQFNTGDYRVYDHEHDIKALEEAPKPKPRKRQQPPPPIHSRASHYPNHETSFLLRESVVGYPSEQPVRPRADPGGVSPVDRPHSFHSGEVSPIEPSDDEGDSRSKPGKLDLQDGEVSPPMVSPLEQPRQPPLKQEPRPIQQPLKVRQPEPTPPAVPAKIPSPVKKPVQEPPQRKQPTSPPKVPSPIEEAPQPSPRTLQSRQRQTDGPADDKKARNREVFVVDQSTPEPRPVSDSSSLSAQDLQVDGTIIRQTRQEPASSQAPKLNQAQKPSQSSKPGQAPNLAPLQEMVEAAPDTSDEASSVAASHHEPQFAPRESSLSASAPKPKPKSIERRQVVTPTPPPGVDRAAVQRLSPVNSRDSPIPPANRISDGSGRVPKTLGGRVVSGASDNYRESIGSQTSSERQRSYIDARPREDTERSFENLLQGDETVRYTLTPQTMQVIENRDSTQISPPITPRFPPTSIDTRTQSPRVLPTATSTQPPTSNGTSFVINGSPVTRRDNSKDIPEPTHSTVPEKKGVIPRNRVGHYQTPSAEIARSQGKIRTRPGPHLQARSPIVKGGETSDLIDFIRQGPSSNRDAGARRIPRTVAPFRNTLDSDEMNQAAPRRQDNSSITSTNDSYMGRSVQSSTNSRTALIDRKNHPDPRRNQGRGGPDPDGPRRKQTRSKDPYEIDDDSDDYDEEDDVATPIPSRGGRDESLLDFLNSAPPPEPSGGPVALNLSPETIRQHQRRYSAIHGNTNTNTSATTSTTSVGGAMRSKLGSISSRARGAANRNRAPSPPPKSPVENRSPIYNQLATSNRMQPASMGRPPVRRPAPRDPTTQDNSMRDLAAFLKDSAPPAGNNEKPRESFVGNGYGNEDKPITGGIGKMFGRRKQRT